MSDERIEAHAPLGPSAAEGWATCSDYVNANRGLPDVATVQAAEGTFAHSISDMCMSLGFDAGDFMGIVGEVAGFTFAWEEEDARLLQYGIDRVRSIRGDFYGEHRVSIDEWTIPGQFGTMDRAVIGDKFIYIGDLKWGRYPVYPVENKQLVLYALGFWNDVARHVTNNTKFILEIDQPRCAGGGGVWETDLSELLEFGEWLRGRALLTQQPNPSRTASEKGCQWCRRRKAPGGCSTYEEFMSALLVNEFEDVEQTPSLPKSLTPEQRSFVLQHRKMIENWLDLLEEKELEDYLAGNPTPGRKAVVDTQKGTRDAWIDKAKAKDELEKLIPGESCTETVITPKQALKKVDPKDHDTVKALFKPGQNGISMVPLDDKRQAIPVVLPSSFEDLE